MPKFKPESDAFRLSEAMRFLCNLLSNLDERIGDDDVFAAPASLTSSADVRSWYRTALPESVRNRLEGTERDRDSVSFSDPLPEVLRCLWCQRPVRPRLRAFLSSLAPKPGKGGDAFSKRLSEFCSLMRFGPVDRDLLLVSYFIWSNLLEWPTSRSSRSNRDARVEALAMYVDRSVPEVRAALASDAPLVRSGALDDDLDFSSDLSGFFAGIDKRPLASRFFRKDEDKPLPWTFFGRLASGHGALLRKMLAPGAGPANVLLYGAPGTGKTSFARALAAETGRTCYFVSQDPGGERRGDGARGSAALRFSALRVADGRVDPDSSLLVVDEADDMLGGSGGSPFSFLFGGGRRRTAGDKGLLNSVLDGLKTPAVWIANSDPDDMDESSRRRFDYSVRFDALGGAQRASVWRNQIAEAGLGTLVDGALADEFAGRWPVSAGGIAGVLRNVKRLKPAKDEVRGLVETLMKPHCELLGLRGADDRLLPARDYSLDGLSLSSSVPLPRIVAAARSFRAELDALPSGRGADLPRFNLLLSGPPGTGKTEFVKFLGAELGAKVCVRMGSDLLSCWVGGTEKNIAAAFREAEAENAVLFLDEVDGLLRSRNMAQRSWEVTQVNELLHRMENFRGVLVCATNFSDNLDPATVRRFTFKVAFDYLRDDGKALFFERFFGHPLSPRDRAELDAIPDLAPGDFRTVRQSLRYLGGPADAADLLRALREESDAKHARGGSRSRRIGF